IPYILRLGLDPTPQGGYFKPSSRVTDAIKCPSIRPDQALQKGSSRYTSSELAANFDVSRPAFLDDDLIFTLAGSSEPGPAIRSKKLLKLKKLQILGFKSFCDRTELKFHGEGI